VGTTTLASASDADPRAVRAGEAVAKYYRTYLSSPTRQTAARFVDGALLDVLYAPPPDVDRLLCAHALPESVSAIPVAATARAATVRVTTVQQGLPRPPITVTVRLSDLRITKVACPVS
jgi:hypothetical protein